MWGAKEQSSGAGAASQGLLCLTCTKSCRFLVMIPLAADSPLVSPKCHLCDPESPGNSQQLCEPGKVKPAKGSAVSAGEVAQQAQWGCQSRGHGYNPGMGSGSHLDLLGPGVPWKEHWEQLQGAAVSQGRIWGLPLSRAVALTDTSSWICSFQGTALSLHCFCPRGKAIPTCGMEQSPVFVLVL